MRHPQALPAVPISQFRVVEHKLGFKPIIACCSCGAVLDRNKRKANAKAFYAEHALCLPKVEVVREDVAQE